MIYTGAGFVVFVLWLGMVWGGYLVLDAYDVGPWASLGSAVALAAVVVFLIGRHLNRDGPDHTLSFVPAQWIGVVAPIFFGVIFGLAELLR